MSYPDCKDVEKSVLPTVLQDKIKDLDIIQTKHCVYHEQHKEMFIALVEYTNRSPPAYKAFAAIKVTTQKDWEITDSGTFDLDENGPMRNLINRYFS